MADYTRNLPGDVFNVTTVDNNAKAEAGAGPPMVQVAPEGDEFGTALDGNWVEMTGAELWAGGKPKQGSSISEAGGALVWASDNVNPWGLGERRNISYKDADIAFVFYPTDSATTFKDGQLVTLLWKDISNSVFALWKSRCSAPNHFIRVYKVINGAMTKLSETANLGVQAYLELRIKRVAATNTFTMYYRLSGDPTAWTVLYGPAVIVDATHFPVNADLYPIVEGLDNVSGAAFVPECEEYSQKTDDGIAAQRFWPDSPEADIKDSVNCGGGESYAFDAAVGKTWSLTGASSVEDGDGGTVRWKVGFSDAADGSGITWDGAWRTIAQVNTNAAAGNYDGHRYLYAKWQGNSDNTQQPNATSFTISGTTAGAGIASSIFEPFIFKSGVFR